MITGPLEQAFQLSQKYRMNVSTVTELQKILLAEIGDCKQYDAVLTQILKTIDENKHWSMKMEMNG